MKKINRSYLAVAGLFLTAFVFLSAAIVSVNASDTPSLSECNKIKKLWEQGDFTARFGGIADATYCEQTYYLGTWNNRRFYDQNLVDQCTDLKKLYDYYGASGFSSTFPSQAFEAGRCQQNYWGMQWWEKIYEGDPGITEPYCQRLKKLWDQGDFTARFGNHMGEVRACVGKYYNWGYWNNKTYEVSGIQSTCEAIKRWWDAGGFTAKHANQLDDARMCERDYWGRQWNVIIYEDVPELNMDECNKIKRLWEQGNFTARFGSSADATYCEQTYYPGQAWHNKIFYDSAYVNRCTNAKKLYDENGASNFSSNFPTEASQANDCQKNYWGLEWWKRVYDYIPPASTITRTSCNRLKKLWDQGDFTVRFGYQFNKVKACVNEYYNWSYWNKKQYDDSEIQFTCEIIKRWWDAGDFTAQHRTELKNAKMCRDDYWGNQWNIKIDFDADTPELSLTHCKKIKKLWEQGDFTARFGDISEPIYCQKNYYPGDSWHNKIFYDSAYVNRCTNAKKLYDENGASNFSSNFPTEASRAKDCQKNYWGMQWWKRIYDYIPPTIPPVSDISRTSCQRLKKLWDQGDFTARFGYQFDKVRECVKKYYDWNYWNKKQYDDSSIKATCERIKRWWDTGDFTSTHRSYLENASMCARDYWGEQWGQKIYDSDSDTSCSPRNKTVTGDALVTVFCKGDVFTHTPSGLQITVPFFNENRINLQIKGSSTSFAVVYNDKVKTIRAYNYGDVKISYPVTGAFQITSVVSGTTPTSTSTTPPAGYEDEVLTLPVETNPFSDTNMETLGGKAAADLYNKGIIGGFSDGTFRSEKEVNRAETAKFILLALDGSVDLSTTNNGLFKDVLNNQWYTPYVVVASVKGIIGGYPDGTFKPARRVNTAEFLKMITNAFGLEKNLSHPYRDVKNTKWYAQYAGVAKKYNLFPNRSRYLRPSDKLSRQDVAIAIYQLLQRL